MISLKQFFLNTDKKRIYKLSKLFEFLLFFGPVLIFIITINEILKVGVGSIIGAGHLELGAPGESQVYSVLYNWGSGIGFYLYLISIIVFSIQIFYKFLRKRRRKV